MARRRGNGEGSISERADGRWMGRYTVETPTGPKRKYNDYAPTRKGAAEKLTSALAARNGGALFTDADELSLGEYIAGWLETSVKGSVKAISYEQYARMVRVHVAPALGHIKLVKLTPGHLQSFYQSKLADGMAPGSVRQLHTIVHRALSQAHKWRLVHENVAAATDPPKPQPKEIRPLDADQAMRLLDATRGTRFGAAFVLALTTGARIGEILALHWDDAEPDRATMRIARTLSEAKGGPRFTTPKSGKGRSVKLTALAVEALHRHRARQNEERLRAGGAWCDNDLVFTTRLGTPYQRVHLEKRHFRPLLAQADLPRITLHDLRYTAATLLLSEGVHPKLVQELLGHSSIAITLDRYSHFLPSMGDQTALAMDAALSR
jgi:integrase